MLNYRKLISITAVLVCLALLLTGCGKKKDAEAAADDAVFAVGTTLNGQDLSLLSAEGAAAYLAEQAENYTLTVVMGDTELTAGAEDLKLSYNTATDLSALLAQQAEDGTTEFTDPDLFDFDLKVLDSAVELYNVTLTDEAQVIMEQLSAELAAAAEPAEEEAEGEESNVTYEVADPYAAQDACLTYSEAEGAFVISGESSSRYLDAGMVTDLVSEAVLSLTSRVDVSECTAAAERTADDPALMAALDEANACLALELTYTFTPDDGETSTVTIDRATLASLFTVDETGTGIVVDEEVLGSYVSALSDTYSVSGGYVPFTTSNGGTLNLTVASAGQSVDSTALYEDMLGHLNKRESGTFEAPYVTDSDNDARSAWGGNYVEVDLSSQHLWCYHNGTCVVSCSVVSGCVADNTRTPTGCFTIFSMDKDRYLQGTNVDGSKYKSWVSYFMPFSGGCGIHDATWRSNFGGSIYLYNGSHGCVGVSLSNAKTIFNNVSVGTHVVIYGGATSVDQQSQGLSVSANTTMTVGDTQTLSVSSAQTTPTYSSSNTAVVTVDSDGKVTAVGAGSATITVSCPESSRYAAASKTVTITVSEKAAEHVHTWVDSTTTVHHDEVGHYETKSGEGYDEIVTVYVCADGARFYSESEAIAHAVDLDSESAYTTETETVHHDGESTQVWVVDTAAYDETVTTTTCSGCGETKK